MELLRSAAIALGLVALGSYAPVRADVLAYALIDCNGVAVCYDASRGAFKPSDLYSVDLSTATATRIGSTGTFNNLFVGLALSPDSTLFGTDEAGALYTLDKNTGAATFVAGTPLGDIEGLAFDGNTLLGTNYQKGTTIYSINTTNGAAIPIVTASSVNYVHGMALLDSNHVIVEAGDPPAFGIFQIINLTTGSVTNIGDVSSDISSAIFAIGYGDGVLYGLASVGDEYKIDQTNASLTLVGDTGAQASLT